MLDAPTERFIAESTGLSAESLAAAYDRVLELRRSGGREASLAAKPSASENSELEKAVRTALHARASELGAFRPSLPSQSASAVTLAARAILKRSSLSPEQYALLTEPFAGVGVDIPPQSP